MCVFHCYLYFFQDKSIYEIVYKTSIIEGLLQPGESVQMTVDVILLAVGKITQNIMYVCFTVLIFKYNMFCGHSLKVLAFVLTGPGLSVM